MNLSRVDLVSVFSVRVDVTSGRNVVTFRVVAAARNDARRQPDMVGMFQADAQVNTLIDAWRTDIDSVPFTHHDALALAVRQWAARQRFLAGVRCLIGATARRGFARRSQV